MGLSCQCTIFQLETLSRRLGTFVEIDENDSWCDAVKQLPVDTDSLLKDYVTALDALKYDGAELVVGCVGAGGHVHCCALLCMHACMCMCVVYSSDKYHPFESQTEVMLVIGSLQETHSYAAKALNSDPAPK